ncbi:MAG: ribosome biogenesis GTPase Der [Deltaproteobacteria bacterium]|nr:ribosome biogenesis GTPase Der [Deltaproteobacteria bacterium]
MDTARQEDLLAEFARLGSASIVPISAEHGRRIDELLDAILAALARRPGGVGGEGYPERAASMGMTPPRVRLSAAEARKPPPRFMADPPTIVGGEPTRPESLDPHQGVAPLRIAIIGRPNVGKSTLVNRLAGAPRVVAHELPGTTRDAIDVAIIAGRNRYLLVDTAGIRRKSKSLGRVEKFSIIKALQAMERADVAIIVMDASEGCTHQDRQLVAEVARAYRPALIALNKWDLVPRARWTAQVAATREVLGELNRLPIQPIAASTGRDCARLLPLVRRLAAASSRRFQTAALNRLLVEAQRRHHLPSYRTQPVRCYYATQVGVAPPTFTIFANYPDAIPESYQRYLRKAIEVAIGAPGLPIRLRFLRRR